VIWRHKWWNLARCLILPLALASYIAQTLEFYKDSGTRGAGHVAALPELPPDLLGYRLLMHDPTGGGAGLLQAALAAAGVNSSVETLPNRDDIGRACRSNLNARSDCFGAVFFDQVDPATGELNYTLGADFGLNVVDVDDWTKDDFMRRLLPLQWAIDAAWVSQITGTAPPRPDAWLYTALDKDAYDEKIRLEFLDDMRGVLVISFVVNWLFIAYHLPGYVAAERAAGLTELLEAMGCGALPRILSWHFSITASHFPSFVAMAAIYRGIIFKNTNMGFLLISYMVMGVSIASWAFFVAVPFSKKPTLAAIATFGLTFVGAIVGILVKSRAAAQCVLTLFLPTSLVVFVHRNIASWEVQHLSASFSWTKQSPAGDAPALLLIVFGLVNIVLWPFLAIVLDRAIFGLPSTHSDKEPGLVNRLLARFTIAGATHAGRMDPRTAIHVSHLRKSYDSRRFFFFGRRKSVLAIEDLSFDVPRGEIFCLLGRNGAAKSTALSIIAGLTSRTSGDVQYAPDLRVGIAGQKDVLWDDLDCEQHAALWRAIKGLDGRRDSALDLDLLARCDLTPKAKCLSSKLSGGQKRKLQLACALAGGSNLLLLDEISSGLDPLSRRAIWKVLADVRGHGLGGSPATVVLTTHFLDEADYLGDEIAILKAPGRLLAVDSPVGLKTRLGHGFILAVDDARAHASQTALSILDALRAKDPNISMRATKGRHLYTTGSNDVANVRALTQVLARARARDPDLRYTVGSTTLEDVFIELNRGAGDVDASPRFAELERDASAPSFTDKSGDIALIELQVDSLAKGAPLALTPGEKRPWWRAGAEMAASVTHKRLWVLRRAWLIPVVAVLGVALGATVPMVFMNGRSPSCEPVTTTKDGEGIRALTYPYSWLSTDSHFSSPLFAPGDAQLGNWTATPGLDLRTVENRAALESAVRSNMRNETFGGIALAPGLVAYEGDPDKHILQVKGLSALNLYSNARFQELAPGAPFRIRVSYGELPYADFAPTGKALLWITFFGMVMAIWPAFATIYPATEKRAGVRINQYSNGARPAALWAGHLAFEVPGILIVATIVTVAAAGAGQFTALGQFWACLVLYGLSATCYAYLLSVFFKTSFGAWAAVASINGVVFLYYVVMYQVIQLNDKTGDADRNMAVAHYGYAVIHPVASIVRAAFVSVNIFNLLCDGRGGRVTDLGKMNLYGAPVVYMLAQGALAFTLLVWVDSGYPIPHWARRSGKIRGADPARTPDVLAEAARAEASHDALVVDRLTKQFEKKAKPSVDDVTFGVAQGDTFALIGPNGAGKTTTLGVVRGVTQPTRGDVRVTGYSIVRDRNHAREALGVCPQHSAIDDHLTVRQHLWLYGRLKGVSRAALARDVEALLAVSGLTIKSDELASSLSGGNQRKLSLACALIGDRPVILIDEFSSGVDPFSKREAWHTVNTPVNVADASSRRSRASAQSS
jgi:ABC-type multidrug transport system ATPase subunit